MTLIDQDNKQQATPDGGQQQQQATPSADWLSSLGQDERALVEARGYKSPADLAKAYVNANKLLTGGDKVLVPKDGVWDETARVKLGIPTDPKGYKFERPQLPAGLQYDEKFEQSAFELAHKVGLTQTQAKELMAFYVQNQGNAYAQATQMQEQARTETTQALQKEWGKAFDQKIQEAARAAKDIGGDELIEYLNNSGAGDNPHIIKAFAKVGEMLREDSIPGGTRPSGMALTPDQARAEANKLMATEAYRNRDHAEHRDTVKAVQKFFEMAYPEQN